MSALQTQCPPEEVLNDFGLGKLDAASVEAISRHLETCAECQQRVASLPGDSFIGRLRQAGDTAQSRKRDGTYVPGESMANASGNTPWGDLPRSPTQEAGPSRTVDGGRNPDGLGSPSSVTAPPELANHPDYELIKELGQGGMGTVYLAKNRMMDRTEVLKVISQSLLDKPGALERFQQEIRSAAKLSHPNIVAAHSVLRPGDLLVFAMEYVRGQDLAEVVKQRGPLPVANAAFYIHQIAQGLQHAFERGMVHRDIKPNNLMLAIEGKKHVVKILDFGLAKATSEKGGETGLTKSGQLLGTPDYVAPEQTLDAHKADIRADIYSLGCTLYFLLSGGPPFQETSLYEILEAHHKREPKPLNLVRPEVPVELAAVVARMMAKNPTKRYQTPIEVAKALVPFFKPGQSAVTPPPAEIAEPRPAAETEHGRSAATPAAPIAPPPAPFPSPLIPLVTAPAAVSAPESEDLLTLSIDTRRPEPKRRAGWSWSLPPWQRWALAGGAATAVLVAGIVFLLPGKDAVIRVEVNDPQIVVAIKGTEIILKQADNGHDIKLAPGEKTLVIERGDFRFEADKLTLKKGETITVAVTLLDGQIEVRRENNLIGHGKLPGSSPDPVSKFGQGAKKAAPQPSSDGFVPLFNGKDLTGWKPQPDSPTVWRVENGILTGSGEASGYLFTERGNLTNFRLHVEARINDRGDSGVYFRASPGRDIWPKGYEAQINTWDETSDKTGSLYGWGGAGPMVRVALSVARPNEWFTLEIFASDNHIVITVNGKTTADSIDHARRFPMGHIALEKYRPGTVVEFRKIEIKELESVAAARPSVVPADAQEFGGRWYKFYPEQLTWKAARDRCQSLGGGLAIIGSLAENTFVASLVEAGAWQDAWIGATDEEEEGKWRDVEGKPLAFTSWSPTGNQPNNKHKEEHYALMSKRAGWRWSDQPNASKEHKPGFVCEWGP